MFSPDRRLVYTGIAEYFSITDARTGASVALVDLYGKGDGDIDGIENPMSIAVAPDGSAVYATMPDVGQISVLDPRTGKERSRISLAGSTKLRASGLAVSSDGSVAAGGAMKPW